MKKVWLIWPVFFLLLMSSAFAQETIQKTFCMSSIGYKGSMEDLKKELLYNAKRAAVSEIFGKFITSFTKVEQSTLIEDKIRAYSVGLIRIKGDPVYYQGKNLGEVCVKIYAYAKKEDFEKFKPKQLSKKTCLMEGDVKTIKGKAQEKAKLAILVDYDQSLKKYPPEKILPLLHEVKYPEEGFVPDTSVYCVRATGTIYPIEILSIKEELAGANILTEKGNLSRNKPIAEGKALKANKKTTKQMSNGLKIEHSFFGPDKLMYRGKSILKLTYINRALLSPDRKRIIVNAYETHRYLFILNSDGSNQIKYETNDDFTNLVWTSNNSFRIQISGDKLGDYHHLKSGTYEAKINEFNVIISLKPINKIKGSALENRI